MIDGIPLLQPQVQAGSLTPLAVSAAKRLPGLEQVPAASETVPGFDVAGWFALLAPKGVAPEIVARVNSDTIAILRQDDIIARLRDVGVYPDPGQSFARATRCIHAKRIRAVRQDRQIGRN